MCYRVEGPVSETHVRISPGYVYVCIYIYIYICVYMFIHTVFISRVNPYVILYFQGSMARGEHILWTMGSDFQYVAAEIGLTRFIVHSR